MATRKKRKSTSKSKSGSKGGKREAMVARKAKPTRARSVYKAKKGSKMSYTKKGKR